MARLRWGRWDTMGRMALATRAMNVEHGVATDKQDESPDKYQMSVHREGILWQHVGEDPEKVRYHRLIQAEWGSIHRRRY